MSICLFNEDVSVFCINAIFANHCVECVVGEFFQSNHSNCCTKRMTIGHMLVEIRYENETGTEFAFNEMGEFMLFDVIVEKHQWTIFALDGVLSFDVRRNGFTWHVIGAMWTFMNFIKMELIVALLHMGITKCTIYEIIAIIVVVRSIVAVVIT